MVPPPSTLPLLAVSTMGRREGDFWELLTFYVGGEKKGADLEFFQYSYSVGTADIATIKLEFVLKADFLHIKYIKLFMAS